MRRTSSLFIAIALFLFSGCSWFYANESYRDSWQVTIDGKPMLITYTNYYKGGKSRTEYDYFRVINPANGEIIGEAEYDVRGNPINEKLLTTQSLFIKYEDGWECRKLKDLSLRWDNEGLIDLLSKKNKAVKKIHEIRFYNDTFNVTNTQGEKFRFSRAELEGSAYIPLHAQPPSNYELYAPVSKKIGTDSTKADSAKIAAFNAMINNYYHHSGITTAGDVLLLEGENRSVLKHIDTSTLEAASLFPDKIWLNGDFLRLHGNYRGYYDKGIIVSSGKRIFIYYHTSLNEEEDKTHMACVDLSQQKISWDKPLKEIELDNDFKPKENYMFSNMLVTIWINTNNKYVITGTDAVTGTIKWRIEK